MPETLLKRGNDVDERREGMKNNDIAQWLNLSAYTVKSHIHNILEKMALHSRLQIAAHSKGNKEL